MLSIEERIAYWNMLLRQQPTGNPVVDRVNHEEIRAALRDALADLKAERRRAAAIANDLDSHRSYQPTLSAGY